MFTPPLDSELLEYGPFDYKIKIKKDKEPTFMLIYLLSQKELAVLDKYIKDNLRKGNI
jgi:hypothetical protein